MVGAVIRPLAQDETSRLATRLAAMDPWRRLDFSAETLKAYLDREDAALRRMAWERDGVVGGVIGLRAPWLRGPYVEILAVLPDHQGQGIGAALMAWAIAQGGGNLWVSVSDFNHSAQGFYARMGFAETARLADLVRVGETEILMRRRSG